MPRLDMTELNGRWFDVLSGLGINKDFLQDAHGPCPICGGHDRFRWDNKEGRGTWFCSHCGAGDGAELAMRFLGCDFRTLRPKLEAIMPGAKAQTSSNKKGPKTPEECRAAMNKIWGQGDSPIPESSPVSKYLRKRLGAIYPTKELRSADYGTYFLLLARVRSPDGAPCQVHRTYIDQNGVKLARKMMEGDWPKGSAVRLMPPDGGVLGIAEGLENALSAYYLDGVPCWAALNANQLAGWIPPQDVSKIIVYGDRDSGYVGQSSAYQLAERVARNKDRKVEVRLPMSDDQDWNEVYQLRIGDGDSDGR